MKHRVVCHPMFWGISC